MSKVKPEWEHVKNQGVVTSFVSVSDIASKINVLSLKGIQFKKGILTPYYKVINVK